MLSSRGLRTRAIPFWLISLGLALLVPGCSALAAPSQGETLTVFAAASLADAFEQIGAGFEAAHPGITVQFNFAGSQSLRAQIEQGAQADVFASANDQEVDALVSSGFVHADNAHAFLTNQMVVVLPAANPAGLKELADIASPGVKLVLAAQEVPAGGYTLQVLENLDRKLGAGFKEAVLANVVSYENDVRQVLTKVQLGEADAGIVYASDAAALPELGRIEIPSADNAAVRYKLAVLAQSNTPELAREFTAYVLSPEGQAILQEWGFTPLK